MLSTRTITALYEGQHRIWPGWSRGDAGAAEAAAEAADVILRAARPPPGLVVDLGCGAGREAMALARRGRRVLGVDLSAALVRMARRAAAGEAARAARFVLGDYRSFHPPEPPALVYFWDSALNLLPPGPMGAVLRRQAEGLAPGGVLLVQQLAREHFEGADIRTVIADPAVGPGTTRRHYLWNPEAGRLEDRIVHEAGPDAPPEALPTQVLHLPAAGRLASMLTAAGLRNVRVIGSHQWAWLPEAASCPDVADWRMVIALGRRVEER